MKIAGHFYNALFAFLFCLCLHFFASFYELFEPSKLNFLKSEKQIQKVFLRNSPQIIGSYNSAYCKKCLGFFIKIKRELQKQKIFNLHKVNMHMVDRAFFKPNITDYMDRYEIFFIFKYNSEVEIVDRFYNYSMTYFQNEGTTKLVVERAVKSIKTRFHSFEEITSFEQLQEILENKLKIVLFAGEAGLFFDLFYQLTLENSDIPFYFTRDKKFIIKIILYFNGYYESIRTQILIVRKKHRKTHFCREALGIIQQTMDKGELLRFILIEMIERVNTSIEDLSMNRMLKNKVPIVLYVLGSDGNSNRSKMVSNFFEFADKNTRTAFVGYLSHQANVFKKIIWLTPFASQKEDKVYFLKFNGPMAYENFVLYEYKGNFENMDLLNNFFEWNLAQMMLPRNEMETKRIFQDDFVVRVAEVLTGKDKNKDIFR